VWAEGLKSDSGLRHVHCVLVCVGQVVQTFMMVNGADPATHIVATTFPRVVITDSQKTLGELGCAPQMQLNIEPK